MEELDLLKNHWKKEEEHFPKISSERISGMIHKNSSSTVKWIFIISLLEFVLGLTISFLIGFFIETDRETDLIMEKMDVYLNILSAVFYIVIIYFIISFYRMYRRIKVTDSTKKLTETIIRTRQIVKKYIVFNISMIFISMFFGGIASFFMDDRVGFDQLNWLKNVFVITFLLLFSLTFCFIIWIFYRIIYGWLIRRLKRNHEELINIGKLEKD